MEGRRWIEFRGGEYLLSCCFFLEAEAEQRGGRGSMAWREARRGTARRAARKMTAHRLAKSQITPCRASCAASRCPNPVGVARLCSPAHGLSTI